MKIAKKKPSIFLLIFAIIGAILAIKTSNIKNSTADQVYPWGLHKAEYVLAGAIVQILSVYAVLCFFLSVIFSLDESKSNRIKYIFSGIAAAIISLLCVATYVCWRFLSHEI